MEFVQFHVHFMSDMSKGCAGRPVTWRNPKIDFPHTYWRDSGFRHYHLNPGLIYHLRKVCPDFLLVGCPFDTFTSILAAWLCPAGIRCTWSEGNTKTPGVMTGFKGWFKRVVFPSIDTLPCQGMMQSSTLPYIRHTPNE